jgi:cytochrome P450
MMCLVLRMEQCELIACWMQTFQLLMFVPRFAGSDSTASTMQSFFYYVLSDARVYAKLQREVDEAQKTGQISSIVDYAEAMKLEYFQACLKEAMRIRPAVGLGIYRVVPPEGANIGGQFFPGGTEVSVNGWVLHRDTEVFGDDVETFRPERWFERDVKSMNLNMYQVGSPWDTRRQNNSMTNTNVEYSSVVGVTFVSDAIWPCLK